MAKNLGTVLKVQPWTIDTYMVQKGNWQGLPWNVLHNFILEHLHDEYGMVAFALAIYELILFLEDRGILKQR